MNQSLFMKRNHHTLLEKVVAGLTSLSLMLSYGGASILVALVVTPQVASAATVVLSESFGTGNTVSDIPNWFDGGDTDALTPGSGGDSASPNGGRFAKIADDEYVCRIIDGSANQVFALSYYWRGDTDSENDEYGYAQVRKGDSCTTNSGWINVGSHELDDANNNQDEGWSSLVTVSLPTSETDQNKFALRFKNTAGCSYTGLDNKCDGDQGDDRSQDEYFRVDGIGLESAPVDTDQDGIPDTTDNCPAVANSTQTNTDGDAQGDACDTDDDNDADLDPQDNCPLVSNADQKDSDGDGAGNACDETPTAPENTDTTCADQLDNDDDGLVDLADSGCRGDFTLTKRVVNSDALPSSFTIKLCPAQSPIVSSIQNVFGVSVAYATVMIDPCITLTSGQTVSVAPGWYQVQEAPVANFQQAFTDGACDKNGYVQIARNDNDTCILENTYVPPMQCADGADNDDDGAIDYPEDLDCTSVNDNDESQDVTPQSCTQTTGVLDVVSDTTNTVVENTNLPAVATWDEHTAWTASIPGATWIWESVEVMFPTTDEVKTFVKTFTLPGGPVSASVAVAADNSYRLWVNGNLVCEDATESNFSSGGQDTCVVSPAFLQAGMNTVKIEVKNWALSGGTAVSNPAGALYKLSVVHDTCPYATVSATKIVCDNESDLPNWSGAEMNITGSTASDFLATHESCHLAEGWKFQSANQNGFDAGNGFIGEAGVPYVTSAPTNAQGFTTWTVPLTGVTTLQVREVLQSGFIPFGHNTQTPDVSAEMWCDTDVLNYDNWEWIGSPANGATYHCVAINAPTSVPPEEPVCGNDELEEGEMCDDANTENGDGCSSTCQIEVVDVCPNIAESQTVVPEGMMTDEDGNCIEVPVCDGETNLLANGSFEDPTVSSWETVLTTNPALKWAMEYVGVVTDTDASHKGIEIQRSAVGAPFVGDQHAELDGYHPSLLWQKVTTIPGKEYVLSYAYSPRPNTDASENQLEVSANGVVLSSVGPTASSNVTSWTTASHSVTATSTYLNFAFKDLGPDDSGDTGGLGMYIDGVRLTCRTPEPEVPACADGIDNDEDGDVDFDSNDREKRSYEYEYDEEDVDNDPGCSSADDNDERNSCSDGLDNDQDGLIDQVDPGCANPQDMDESNPSTPTGGGSSMACSDGSDNDADGKSDYPNDLGCSSSNDNDETDVPQPVGPSAPQGGEPAGEVLGAAIEEPAGPSCGEYITTYMKMGKKNDVEEVKKLQIFLNTVMDANIPVTGYFGTITKNWVKKFQKQYHTEIIQPWKDAGWGGKDVENGTGYVFKTTKRWINIMKCDLLRGTPVPELMPDTGNN